MTTVAIKHRSGKPTRLANALRNFAHSIKSLFRLEEVEVTFTKVGDSIRYSYTKINHKHAA